ncbi:MAG: hypothetical protein EHM70_17040, partial [Chloroflexota bacterium]
MSFSSLLVQSILQEMLNVHLFGIPEVEIDGQAIQIPRRKSRALIFYLAAQGEPVSREQLMDLLWTDTPRPAAQQVLRTTLHGLRKILGPSLLVEGDRLALHPESEVDVRRFESLLERQDLDAGS